MGCLFNEANAGETANCYFLCFSASSVNVPIDEFNELHSMWIVTAEDLTHVKGEVEYTLAYGASYVAARIAPDGKPYLAGNPPPGLAPPDEKVLELIDDFCKAKGLTLRDVSASFGMPVKENNEELVKVVFKLNQQARSASAAGAALDIIQEDAQVKAAKQDPLSRALAAFAATHDEAAFLAATHVAQAAAEQHDIKDPEPVKLLDSLTRALAALAAAHDIAQFKAEHDVFAHIPPRVTLFDTKDAEPVKALRGKRKNKVEKVDSEAESQVLSPALPSLLSSSQRGGGGVAEPPTPKDTTAINVMAPPAAGKLQPAEAVKQRGLRFGRHVEWRIDQGRLSETHAACGFKDSELSTYAGGRLRDANLIAGEIICTLESEQGWMLSTHDEASQYRRYHVMHVPIEFVWAQQQEASKPKTPKPKAPPATAMFSSPQKFGYSICIGSTGTACNALADYARGLSLAGGLTLARGSEDMWFTLTGTTLNEWLDGAVWWSSSLCRSLPAHCDSNLITTCDELRHALASFTVGPRRGKERLAEAIGHIFDLVGSASTFVRHLPLELTLREEVMDLSELLQGFRSHSREEIMSHFQEGEDEINVLLSKTWSEVRQLLTRSGDAGLVRDAVKWTANFMMLSLAPCLSRLLDSAEALEELLPEAPSPAEGTTHFHAPSPNAGKVIYNARQISLARWWQHAYRTSRQRLRRMLKEMDHPLICGPPTWHASRAAGTLVMPPLPPFRATGGIAAKRPSEAVRLRYWRAYYSRDPSPPHAPRMLEGEQLQLLREWAESSEKSTLTTVSKEAGISHLFGPGSVGTFRHTRPSWHDDTRKMQCGHGKHLATEATFQAVRTERNRVLRVGAFLVEIFEVLEGHKPRVVVCGGAAGGANHGIARLGGEHVNIDIKPQPAFIKAFGEERFRLGDATSPAVYEPELQVPGTMSMFITLDCQLYSTINKCAMRTGKGDVSHDRQIPDAGDISQRVAPRGFEVVCESARGASRAMQDAFPHTAHLFGWHCGLRTGRPRVFGSSTPVETIGYTARQRELREGMCNGSWRRMPVLDQFGRAVRKPCCRGNTVPVHGSFQPRLPIGLLNQVMGLSPGDMQWLELSQALPPAYSATMFTHMIYATLRRRYGLPVIDFDRVADAAGGISEGLPMQELQEWASNSDISASLIGMLEKPAFKDNDPIDYVSGPTGMHLTPQLDTLLPGDNAREALGPRASLGAFARGGELERPRCCADCQAKEQGKPLHSRHAPVIMAGKCIVRACRRYYARKMGTPRPGIGVGLRGFTRQALFDYEHRGREPAKGQRGGLLALDAPLRVRVDDRPLRSTASEASTSCNHPPRDEEGLSESSSGSSEWWRTPSGSPPSLSSSSNASSLPEYEVGHVFCEPQVGADGQVVLKFECLTLCSCEGFGEGRCCTHQCVPVLDGAAVGPWHCASCADHASDPGPGGCRCDCRRCKRAPPSASTSSTGASLETSSSSGDQYNPTAWSAAHEVAPGEAWTEQRDSEEANALWRRHLDPMPHRHATEEIGLVPRRLTFGVAAASSHDATAADDNESSDKGSEPDLTTDNSDSDNDSDDNDSDDHSPSLPPGAGSSQRGGACSSSTISRSGLQGGARGDGDNAQLANVRFRKLSASIHGPGLAVREGICHGRTQDGQPHAYEVTFYDRPQRRVPTDLDPRLQVDSGRDFPDRSMPQLHEQWQIIGHPSLGGHDMCSQCFYSCSEVVCPICGRSPTGGGRPSTRSTSRRALAALGAATNDKGHQRCDPFTHFT